MLSHFKVSFLLVIGLVLAVPRDTIASQWAPGEVIVKFKDDVDIHIYKENNFVKTDVPLIDAINLRYQVESIEKIFTTSEQQTQDRYITTPTGRTVKVPQLFNIYRFRFPETSDIMEIVRVYTYNPYVEYAEPNYLAHMCVTPNDPMFGDQWGLLKIQAPDAWDIETGDSTVVIGILDTGIDTNHVDLAGNLWVNTDEIPNNGIDDDNNGFIDDIHGWNFVNDTNIVHDGAGHGSHCAGIVSAVTDNSIGVAGTSWDSRLMAVKVLNNNGVGLYSDIAQGIDYAANNGVKVINMSLGGYAYSQMWEDALINAYATAVPVAAAGNDAVSDSFYPACFDAVLGVAATDSLDIKWDGSNYGDWVDLSAPGVGILSTTLDDYGYFTGTSEAAPFISGVAALVVSHRPGSSTGSIMNMITNNTDSIDSLNPGYAGMLGTGRLNAYKALAGDSLPFLVIHSDTIDDSGGDGDGIPDAGETVNLILVLQNNGTDASGVSTILHTNDIDITISDSTASFGDILARERVANSTDVFTFSVSDTCPQHDVLFRLYVTANGGVYNDTIELTITTQNTYNVSGIIDTNTTWRKATYIVDGNVVIDSAVTLTINPGAQVRLDSARAIVIEGALSAIGTSTDSIIFTRNHPDTSARWARLWFRPSASFGIFKYCRIEWAGDCAIYVEGTDSLYIGQSNISNNCAEGDWVSAAVCIRNNSTSATITNNVVYNNHASGDNHVGAGLHISGGAVSCNVIYNNHSVANNWRYGAIWVDGSSSDAAITNNIIHSNSTSSSTAGGGGAIANDGSGTIIDNNTLYDNSAGYHGGGITNGGSVIITNNIIHNNFSSRGGGIANSATATISGNVIYGNVCTSAEEIGGGGIYSHPGYATISNNIIYGNSAPSGGSIGIEFHEVTLRNNTIIDTTFSAIHVLAGSTCVHNNNILATGYMVYNSGSDDIFADSNWWGTTNTDTIDAHIWDFYDDFTLGIVYYQPILTSPSEDAPPYLDSLVIYPDPVGVETLYVYLTFSKPMNTAIAPEVLFAIDDTLFDTLNAYQCMGAWTDAKHWDGWYYIHEMVLDSTYKIKVTEAEDDSGFIIPPDESHTFLVYTAGSAARELFAEPSYNMVSCHWHEAGIANLLGYNLYRSMVSGGPYTQINSTVITDTIYIDYDVSGGNTYYYTYTILDNNFNESSMSSEAVVYVGIEEGDNIPTVFALYKICPNPFVRKASIKYAVPERTHIQLNIYDVQGRLVKTLVDETQKPSYYKILWDGTDYNNRTVASGVYFLKFTVSPEGTTSPKGRTEDYKTIKKLIFLH